MTRELEGEDDTKYFDEIFTKASFEDSKMKLSKNMKRRCEGGFPGFTFVADIAEDTKKDDLKIQDTKNAKDVDWKNEDAENTKDKMTSFQQILDEIDDMIAKSNTSNNVVASLLSNMKLSFI